jgi:DNA-binding NtrC family response regulator
MSVRILLVAGRERRGDQVRKVIDDLKAFGIEAELCSDFLEFGSVWQEGKFAVALIDLDNVIYGGYDPFTHFEDIISSIPSVFLSERGNLEKWARAMESGAVSFVTRPFHTQALSRFILRIINQHINK